MKIGIDISQLAYERTGVANIVLNLVRQLVSIDKENEYVLFYSSLRRALKSSLVNELTGSRVSFKFYKFPPTVLDILWNKLHVLPIENLIGDVDVFISSDWTEPPANKAKKVTILYDLVVYKYPEETAASIVATQKRKLKWVKKEISKVLCISEATKKDAMEILGIEEKKLEVIYPGV